jgi:hypothetical protein
MRAAFGSSRLLRATLCGAAAIVSCGSARADVVISTAATSNMACSGGVCAPTAASAVLNVGDLETLLASGNATVTTTGSGVQATNIQIAAPLSWATTNTLALDAYESIAVSKPVAVAGQGGLSVATNDGGSNGYFSFGQKGNATFADLSSPLTINGAAYTLVNSIASLASAIAANPTGDYALANSYNAKKDGTYSNSPIPTEFGGFFEGLGNTISNLSLNGTGDVNDYVGLFAELALNDQPGGSLENIVLNNIKIGGNGFVVGGLVGVNTGTINGSFVQGQVESNFYQNDGPTTGLLTGINTGTIIGSGTKGAVTGGKQSGVGGLVGGNFGQLTQSYADCKVSGGPESAIGGLTGGGQGKIGQSYAMGSVKGVDGTDGTDVGGLIGLTYADNTIVQSYSTTHTVKIERDEGAYRGGVIGYDQSTSGNNTGIYWDLDTSGVKGQSHGAGFPKHDKGLSGLTSAQFQAGLPQGFDPKVWAEDPKINNGYPYLISNPPRK